MKQRLAWLAAAWALALAPVLRADVPPGPRGPHQKDVERVRRELEQLRERAAAASPSATPSGSTSTAPKPSALPDSTRAEELAKKWAAVVATRLERRARHRSALLQDVGTRLSDPEVQAELQLHSRRLAELSRIEFLAQNTRSGAERDKLLARVARLTTREGARHAKRMANLAPPPAGSAPPAPTPSTEAPR